MVECDPYKFEVRGPSPLSRTICPSSLSGRNTPAGVIRVQPPSWIYTNNVAPDVKQGIKNIPQLAENRNIVLRGSNKDRIGSVIWAQWPKVATSATDEILFVLKRLSQQRQNLCFMSWVRLPFCKPFNFANRPVGRAKI